MPDMSVLVVEDEAPVRELLRRLLTSWKFSVRTAATADEALAAMAEEQAAIMVCDIRLPGRDGLWLVEQVLTRWPDTSVIMATGQDDPATIHTSRALGAVAYVPKPFDSYVLRQAVDRAAGRLRFRPSADPT